MVIRRTGVNEWIAVGGRFRVRACSAAGWENAIRPFQMTFTGALVFGLVFLLLADHDGPIDRRDWFGLSRDSSR